MKKNYSFLFAFFFFIIGFCLNAMQESSISDDLNDSSDFGELNVCNSFQEFYQDYFNTVFPFEKLEVVVKRFSFVFWYLKERNIGNILTFESNDNVDFQKKQLTGKEIDQIKKFFKDTVALIEEGPILKKYLEKRAADDVLFNSFQKAFDSCFSSEDYPDTQNKEIEDLTFLIKCVDNFTPQYIQQRVASDVHSSPEYFGLEYESIDFSGFDITTIPLKELYKDSQARMKKKEVSFFCGDLADRDSLYFLDESNKWSEQENWSERKNFFLYNFFKDYYHTVHAAWQFYCLCTEQSKQITRWQVFGNHETESMHGLYDYKKEYAGFSKLISSIRRMILPTEIYFIQSGGTIVLRHGFFTQSMNIENHAAEKVNKNFKFIYLYNHEASSGEQFYQFRPGFNMNPVYWSDHHDTAGSFNLSVLVQGINDNDEEEPCVDFLPNRGYYNQYSWKKGVDIGKQISIKNFKLFNTNEFCNTNKFLSDDELNEIQNGHWALFCGHSHNPHSLMFSAVKNEHKKTVSFHPYYVFDKSFLFHFCMCSHHNIYVLWLESIFNEINTEKNLRIDWKSAHPVHALETYQGDLWIKAIIPSVIEEFLMMLFDKKYPVKNSLKNQATETEFRENKESEIQTEQINQKFNITKLIAISLKPQESEKLEKANVAIQMGEFIIDASPQTETKDVKSIGASLENIIRKLKKSSFDQCKKCSLSSQEIRAVAEKADLPIQTTNKILKIKNNEYSFFVQPKNIHLTEMIGIGFLGASGYSVFRSIRRQGIKGIGNVVSDFWQKKGKFRLVLAKKDMVIGGGGALIGYCAYSKFAPFFNRKKEDKQSTLRMKEN